MQHKPRATWSQLSEIHRDGRETRQIVTRIRGCFCYCRLEVHLLTQCMLDWILRTKSLKNCKCRTSADWAAGALSRSFCLYSLTRSKAGGHQRTAFVQWGLTRSPPIVSGACIAQRHSSFYCLDLKDSLIFKHCCYSATRKLTSSKLQRGRWGERHRRELWY